MWAKHDGQYIDKDDNVSLSAALLNNIRTLERKNEDLEAMNASAIRMGSPELYAIVEKLAKLRNGLANSNSNAEERAAELADDAHKLIFKMTGASL